MLDFTKLIDPIDSEHLLNTVYTKVFDQSLANNDVTIMGFPGCGKVAYVKYLIRMLPKQLNIKDTNRVFGVIDFAILASDEDNACREFLQNIVSFYSAALNAETSQQLTNLLNDSTTKLTLGSIKQVIQTLTYDMNISVTLVMENFQLFFRNDAIAKFHAQISSIKKANPMKISLVFLVSGEITDIDLPALGILKSYFTYNTVWGKTILFDAESVNYLVKNQESWNQYTFSQNFINSLYAITGADPAVTKIIVTKALKNKAFEQNIIELKNDPEKLYDLIGKQTLDERYKRIVTNISGESLNFLLTLQGEPPEYLYNVGLVYKQKGQVKPLCELFSSYLKTNEPYLRTLVAINKEEVKHSANKVPQELLTILTGQELTILNALIANIATITTRENVAKVLWDNEWETKYSDWAIDQAISRLRAKLKNSKFKIKTLKGKGFTLIQL